MSGIQDRCMVVNLSLGVWEGRRLDKAAGAQVASEAQISDLDAVRVHKLLVPKAALAEVMTSRNALRNHFVDRTLPWRDNGDRVLTRKMFQVFMQEHEALAAEFWAAVDELLDRRYPAAREQAAFRMGKLFNPDDYPRIADLRDKFYARLDIDPIATSDDFRVQLDVTQVEALKAQMQEALAARLERAQKEVWTRVEETVAHFAAKMADEEAIFRDSTVENLTHLIEALPALDLTGDPNLKTIGKRLKATLHGLDPKTLRKDPAARAAVSQEAQEIMEAMKGFQAAMGA
jgi:hypothetical protein